MKYMTDPSGLKNEFMALPAWLDDGFMLKVLQPDNPSHMQLIKKNMAAIQRFSETLGMSINRPQSMSWRLVRMNKNELKSPR